MAIKVRALQLGLYGNKLREPGEEFAIANEEAFSKRWMERVDKEPSDAESKESEESEPVRKGGKGHKGSK